MKPRWLPLHGLLLGAALVLLACGDSPDDETTNGDPPLPPPAQTPVRENVAATSEPESGPPEVTRSTNGETSPAPAGPLSNLRPMIPEGWRSPLIIANRPDALESKDPGEDEPVYISWAMNNNGQAAATSFFVDLYLDGVPVERWSAQELARGDSRIVQGWSDLLVRARLTPGRHELRVMVDSTNLVPESDERDNSHTITFEWPEGMASTRPPTAPSRLPNLAPFTPPGWSSPIRIAEADGSDALTVEVAYRNEGLSSIGQLVQVYLYVDGVLAAKFRERDLIAGEGVLTPAWSGLTQVIPISPGPHTFTLTTDPTDLILETDEGDNTFSVDMVWEATRAPSETASSGANDRPAGYTTLTPPGWDGPIVVTADRGRLNSTDPLPTSGPVYVHWAMRNPGRQDLDEPYTVELSLDGRVIGRWNRLSLEAGAVDFVMDWPLPASVSPGPGPHRMALMVRQHGSTGVDLYPLGQRTFDWSARTSASTLTRYTDNDIRASLRRLEGLLSSSAATLGTQSPTAVEDVIAVVDAVYYSLYGVSMADEPLDVHVLSDESYTLWGNIQCQDVRETISAEVRPSFEASCARLQGFSGFTAQWRGQHHIVAHSERPPVQVLATLAHELGHFRQAVTNPDLDREAPSHAYRSFREAQAYAYQVFFFRTLESLTAQDLLVYPQLHGYESYVDQHLESWVSTMGRSEHSLGRLVLWMALLTDPELRRARTVLLDNRYLTAEAALEVFEYLVSFSADEVEGYVARLLQGVQTQLPAVQAVATSRLISGLPYWNEGSPYLREVGLLLP